jgi:hypothetical protein
MISNNEDPTLLSLLRKFAKVLAVEIDDDPNNTARDQTFQLTCTKSFSAIKAVERLVLKNGATPEILPYEIARQCFHMAIRHPDNPEIITISWGLTTLLSKNLSMFRADYHRKCDHSYYHFANLHPEYLNACTYRFTSDNHSLRRIINNRNEHFGPLNYKYNLCLEDFPTSGMLESEMNMLYASNDPYSHLLSRHVGSPSEEISTMNIFIQPRTFSTEGKTVRLDGL